MHHASKRAIAAVCGLIVLLMGAVAAQRGISPAAPPFPPLSHTCPHHPDVIESAPGNCPACKMALVPVRLGPAWSCPIHPATLADEGGSCPICRRPLVRVTVSVTWSCAGSTTEFLETGICLDGTPRRRTQTMRPHGDHNPRHGGQFFMAPDNWHHVEGAYPAPGLFRFYVYDDYARPLSDEQLRQLEVRVVTRERFDPATRRTVEEAAFPLRLSRQGGFLEARVDDAVLPAEMTAKMTLAPGGDEYRFDFTFMTLSAPSIARAAAAVAAPVAAAAPAPSAAPPSPAGGAAPPPPASPPPAAPDAEPVSAAAEAVAPDEAAPDVAAGSPAPELDIRPIPDTLPGIVEQLDERRGHVAALIERGDLAAVWVPAFAARDLAIALEPHLERMGAGPRAEAEPALQRIVRLAWLLDAHGDSGNRQQLTASYEAFSAAIDRVLTAFEDLQP